MNVVQKVMGHEQASTTLDLYTHTPDDYERRVIAALDGVAANSLPPVVEAPNKEDEDGDEDLL